MYRKVGHYRGNTQELVELIKRLDPAPQPTLPLLYNTTDPDKTAAIYRDRLANIFPGVWTKCFLAIIWPNGSIMPHCDLDVPDVVRTHLVLWTNPDCWCMNDGHWCQPDLGGIYTMEQTLPHASINWGGEPRVHFVVDRKSGG